MRAPNSAVLTLFWLRTRAKARIRILMPRSFLQAARARLCFVMLASAAATACSTMNLPDAPKTIGPVSKPHYKIGAPYQVDGRWYVPKVDENYDETGVASWYGDAFQGKLTANGEVFDKGRISAAHKTLPLPTLAEVENLENGRKIVVRVNDRGPFVGDRIIDLSHAAADELGFTAKGLARVRVRYAGETEVGALAALPGDKSTKQAKVASISGRKAARADDKKVETATPTLSASSAAAGSDPLGQLIASATGASSEAEFQAGVPVSQEFWVEIARIDNLSQLASMQLNLPDMGPVSVQADQRDGVQKQSLRIGPFIDEAIAFSSLARVQAAGFGGARILRGAGI